MIIISQYIPNIIKFDKTLFVNNDKITNNIQFTVVINLYISLLFRLIIGLFSVSAGEYLYINIIAIIPKIILL